MQQCWCVVITGGGSEAKFLRPDVLSDAKQQIPLAGLILSSSSVNSERERVSLPFTLALKLQCLFELTEDADRVKTLYDDEG